MTKVVAAIVILLQVTLLLTRAISSKAVDPKTIVDIGGRKYYFSEVYMTAPETITICQELNMTLAGLETLEEYNAVNNHVTSVLGRTDYHWTSGNRQITTWVWGNSGEILSFFHWASGEPYPTSNDKQVHLSVMNGFMYARYPTWNQRFICEEKSACF